LQAFVCAITTAHADVEEGTVTIDEVVFGTERMTTLCPAGSPLPLGRESSLTARGIDEIGVLLMAAFMDGPDFIFVPRPRPFVFYADNDHWVTF
jgi:hypothetical protein